MLFDDWDDLDRTQHGYVSGYCRFVDDGDIRMVFVQGQHLFTYHLQDKTSERVTWVNVYEQNWATQRQIANAIDKGRRTIQLWVSSFRRSGVNGLQESHRTGAPIKLTPAIKKRILFLREKKIKIYEIAKCCQISASSVKKVLSERKRALEEKQGILELETICVQVTDSKNSSTVKQKDQNDSKGLDDSDVQKVPNTQAEKQESHVEELSAITPIFPQELPKGTEIIDYCDEVENVLAQDRTEDRLRATAGQIQDAQPLFSNTEHVENAGAFMAIVMLSQDACLRTAMHVFDEYRAAFYGLRTMIVTWVLMALLRIKRTEHIRHKEVTSLGLILGLDRAPEVKTIRRKFHLMIEQGQAVEWMNLLAKERVEQHDGPVNVLQVDGHLVVYYGSEKLGNVYSARLQRVVKGQTENWVHLPMGGGALFMVTSPFNEGLTGILEEVIRQSCELCGESKIHFIFDRGGYSIELFKRIIDAGHDITTYRKGKSDDIDLSLFKKEAFTIGERTYQYAPYEQAVELKIYEKKKNKKGKVRSVLTKDTLSMREIRIVRQDDRQTVILTSCSSKKLAAETVASYLFDRTGNQENYFKYMREEFMLDAKTVYKLEEITDEELSHPNPAYVKLEKKLSKLNRKKEKLLAKYAAELIDCDLGKIEKMLAKKGKKSEAKEIRTLINKIDELKKQRETTPCREKLSEANYKKLNEQARTLQYGLIMSAYSLESKLYDMLKGHYKNRDKDGRKLIVGALKTSGSIHLEPSKLIIRLAPQSTPARTRAINQVLVQLNQMKAIYPGSNRMIYFEQTPEPVPVLHSI